jgi:methylated-DNA-[protein]-cysteine S-methyltransferase
MGMSEQAAELFTAIVSAPFGGVGLRVQDGRLAEISYLPPHYAAKATSDPVARAVADQLSAYFKDPDFHFQLDLPELGTPHQRRVWEVIRAIPRGEVLTYGQVASRIGSAARAVGQACGANFFPVVIPCHRVTASSGLGGFGGFVRGDGGFHQGVKRWLLQHEGVLGYS